MLQLMTACRNNDSVKPSISPPHALH